MRALDQKLWRDLWRMKAQAIAIGAVMAVGVMLLVNMTSLVTALSETREAYYDRYRLADVFAPVARAPERIAERLETIPGIVSVQTRVTGRALIDIDRQALPIQAQAVSLPDRGRPALNDVYLTEGRMPDPARPDEVLILDGFANAHGLGPGDTLRATMNGVRRTFSIVGQAQSPEFLYTAAPGELIPDDARFGVLWMSRSALAAAYDMSGAFNEVLLGLARTARENEVLDAVDRLLDPHGGTGAFLLADQMSNRFITEEIEGLRASSKGVPPIFLGVAAFLLYIVTGRIVESEREEIGLLKAFGYTNGEVDGHYVRFILVIAIGGAVAGGLGGIALSRGMIGIYTEYYKFPFVIFRLDPAPFVIGIAASATAALVGGYFVLRRVFALTPASAMRPPTPPDYSKTVQLGRGLAQRFDQPTRMVLRRVLRQPVRMAGATVGIACGMALSAAMLTIFAGFNRTMEMTFAVADRSDVTVTFTHPVSDRTLFEMRRIPGVQWAEPVRHVSAVLRNGRESYRGALTGLPPAPQLNRALDKQVAPIDLPEKGVVLSAPLAKRLDIAAGEQLIVEVREGHRPVLEVPVSGLAETLLGAPAYMNLDALNRLMHEPGRISGAYLMIDEARADEIFADLQDRPNVAGLSRKAEAREAFVKIINSGAGSVRYVMAAMAFVIAFGIVYNAARIAFAERTRDLATLRVMGFTHGEASFVLLGELAVVTMVALPLGAVLGYQAAIAIAERFSTDLYQIPADFVPESYGQAMLVVLAAGLVSGWFVKRDLRRLDLVEALRSPE